MVPLYTALWNLVLGVHAMVPVYTALCLYLWTSCRKREACPKLSKQLQPTSGPPSLVARGAGNPAPAPARESVSSIYVD